MAQSVDGCPSNKTTGRTTVKIVDIISRNFGDNCEILSVGWAKIWFLMGLNKFI